MLSFGATHGLLDWGSCGQQRHAQQRRVHCPSGAKFALVESKRIHAKKRRLKITEVMEKLRDPIHRNIAAATSQRGVRMKNPHIERGEAAAEQSVIYLLTQLKQSGVSVSNTGPDHVRLPFRRKSSNTLHRQNESLDSHRRQRAFNGLALRGRNVTDKAQRQVILMRWRPRYAANRPGLCRQGDAHGFRRVNSDKEPQRLGNSHAPDRCPAGFRAQAV
jgi:hypothetical protein